MSISRFVTEYRAQILEDEQGLQFVAPFPPGVNRPAQYEPNLVYLSQYQLLPYVRVREHFHEQLHIGLSVGSVFNFNQEAYEGLAFWCT